MKEPTIIQSKIKKGIITKIPYLEISEKYAKGIFKKQVLCKYWNDGTIQMSLEFYAIKDLKIMQNEIRKHKNKLKKSEQKWKSK